MRFIALKSKSCEIKWNLCEPKQNLWEMWGLEVEEVAENPPEDDDDGGDDGDDCGVEARVEAWEVAAPIAVGQE